GGGGAGTDGGGGGGGSFVAADALDAQKAAGNHSGGGSVTITALAPPTILVASPAAHSTSGQVPVDPFAGDSITDANVGTPAETLTVTPSATTDGTLSDPDGSVNPETGVFSFTGTAQQVTTALDALVFTPSAGDVGTMTAFTISDTSSAYPLAVSDATTTVTDEPPICYLAGTHILTPTGEVLVEDLKIGDLVVTRYGGIQPVKWIGRQSYDSRFIRHNRAHIPVCIQAGALADHMPARDLSISPGHSMLVGDKLLLARSLVNGISITQDNCPPEVHYFQIELESHDCVIAEGAWSETFADGPGLREKFHNAAEFAELYPNHPPPSELALCAPRPERGPRLDAALRPVVARTAANVTPGPLRGHIDRIDAPWMIEGWAHDTDHPELPVLLEVLLGEQVIGTTLASDHRQDLEDAGFGQGRSAFFLTSPVRLCPEMLSTLRIRRVTDLAEIQMTPECRARIEDMRQGTAPGLSRVA
ncbi:MAG: Hint domain-containing protein, partial [Acetobacteraceae bacterium]